MHVSGKYDWQLLPQAEPAEIKRVAQELGVTPLLANILVQRGITDADAWANFTQPELSRLHDPMLMHDMGKAVARITAAIENGEHITIYGDYDVDGITSATIMKEALESIGADPEVYIPNRFADGYGPNLAAYQRLAANGTQLVITTDNGIAGAEPIAWAMANGMDVVVTDHHELAPTLPEAVAVVHPRYPGSEYPFGQLSGAGVALKVATALLGEVPVESIDLAALGAVADVVSLTDENRIFVQVGLQMMRNNPRVGLAALMEAARVDPATVNEITIGFALAPRLNAIGRMGDATEGVTLLSTFDEDEAKLLAGKINQTNSERQALVKSIYAEASAMARDDQHRDLAALVLAHPDWHQGVLGIVASRIVEDTGKPTVILSIDPASGEAKGSGRSVAGYNLFDGLNASRDLMTHFGGHAMAAGLSLPVDQVAALQEALAKDAAGANIGTPKLAIAAQVDVQDLTMDAYRELRRLAPFGEGNLEPSFALNTSAVDDVAQMGADKSHLRFRVGGSIRAVDFGAGDLAEGLSAAQKVKVAFHLATNTYKGNTSLQLMVQDIQMQSDQVIDMRMPQLTQSQVAGAHTYVFFNPRLAKQLTQRLQFGGPTVMTNQLTTGTTDVVLVDLPSSEAELAATVQRVDLPVGALFFAPAKQILAIPSRSEFGAVLRFLSAHPRFDKHQLPMVARATHLDTSQVIFAVQVFLQLKFVTIDDGVFISTVSHPQKQALEDAPVYQERVAQLGLARRLRTASRADLRTTLLRYRQEL